MADEKETAALLGPEWSLDRVVFASGGVRIYGGVRAGEPVQVAVVGREISAQLDAAAFIGAMEAAAHAAQAAGAPRVPLAWGELADGRLFAAERHRGHVISDVQRELVDHLDALLGAVEALHAHGLVHGLVHPEVVYLDGDRVALGLIGLEGAVRTAGLGASETVHLLGSVPHASPEQVEGRAPDARSDVFSLGVLAYEAITGKPPFGGRTTTMVMAAVLSDDDDTHQPGVPDTRAGSIDAVLRAVEKDPEDRWQGVSAFRQALREPPPEAQIAPRKGSGCLPAAVIFVGVTGALARVLGG